MAKKKKGQQADQEQVSEEKDQEEQETKETEDKKTINIEDIEDDEAVESEEAEDEAGEDSDEEEDKPAEDKESSDLEAKNKEISKQLMILQADFQNYKRRMEKEKKDTVLYANEKLILSILSVVDNLERALENGKDRKDAFYEGVEMIYKQLIQILQDSGLAEIESTGETFDHDLHQAVATVEEEGVEPGTIVTTLQKGYKLNDRVIRPSMVRVAK